MPVKEALGLAEKDGLDLVEVAPNSKPPVCRIMDYGKFNYEQSKKNQAAKKKSHSVLQLKEVKMRSRTDVHDFDFKLRHVKRFLNDGHKVKISLVFRGREMAHVELGREKLDKIAEEIKDVGIIEQQSRMEGRNMTMVIAPVKSH